MPYAPSAVTDDGRAPSTEIGRGVSTRPDYGRGQTSSLAAPGRADHSTRLAIDSLFACLLM
jgi:hypothetical protein